MWEKKYNKLNKEIVREIKTYIDEKKLTKIKKILVVEDSIAVIKKIQLHVEKNKNLCSIFYEKRARYFPVNPNSFIIDCKIISKKKFSQGEIACISKGIVEEILTLFEVENIEIHKITLYEDFYGQLYKQIEEDCMIGKIGSENIYLTKYKNNEVSEIIKVNINNKVELDYKLDLSFKNVTGDKEIKTVIFEDIKGCEEKKHLKKIKDYLENKKIEIKYKKTNFKEIDNIKIFNLLPKSVIRNKKKQKALKKATIILVGTFFFITTTNYHIEKRISGITEKLNSYMKYQEDKKYENSEKTFKEIQQYKNEIEKIDEAKATYDYNSIDNKVYKQVFSLVGINNKVEMIEIENNKIMVSIILSNEEETKKVIKNFVDFFKDIEILELKEILKQKKYLRLECFYE